MIRLLKKVMRDLLKDKRRAVFSLIAIIVGSMSFGIITFSNQIIPREIISTYDAMIPASASIMVDRVDDRLIELTESFDDIAIFELRSFHNLRVQVGALESKPLEVYAAKDFNTLRINKVTGETGSSHPDFGEMLIERDATGVARATIGDNLTVVFPNGDTRDFPITGIVHDLTLHPASMHDSVYVYVSYETLLDMGLELNRIDFIITGEHYDRERILAISNEYIRLLEENGYSVSRLDVSNTPGVSMHLEEYEVALFLLQVFSFVSFLFGCMIISNLISSIISGQTRQIGVLKGIGASTGKIIASYMLAIFILILIAATVSVILSTLLAVVVSSATMSIGNISPVDTSVSAYLYMIYFSLALFVPMIIAYFPIRRGVNISVKDAISDYGITGNEQDIKLPELKGLSRPVLLSLRNAVRRKKRFLLNVGTLAIAGAIFVSVVAAMISMRVTMAENLNRWDFDYLFVTTTFADGELSEIIAGIPNVREYENWGGSSGILVNENGELTDSYRIFSPPDNSTMLDPQILEGRWISPDDTNQVVVSHRFFATKPDYAIGDTLFMQIGNKIQEFVIAGSMKDFGYTTVFMSESVFEQNVEEEFRLSNVKLGLNMEGRARAIYRAVDVALDESGILVLQARSRAELHAIAQMHYDVIMQTFFLVISLSVIVSGFGLAATMNAQTSERIKEIGIMKAMGASQKQVRKIITSESIFISLISWGIAILLGIPFGIFSVYIFGNMVLETPLNFNVISLIASYAIWLLLTFAIGYYASKACAKRAGRINVKAGLAFD